MFRGSIVALVTPLDDDKVDVKRLRDLVEFHISEGTHAIVAAGTTGESGTLNKDEKLLVIKTVVDQARERIPVIAGTAGNDRLWSAGVRQFSSTDRHLPGHDQCCQLQHNRLRERDLQFECDLRPKTDGPQERPPRQRPFRNQR